MKVAMIDPSKYSYPYDHCLMNAYSENNIEVEFYTSRFRHGEEFINAKYNEKILFYKFSSWLDGFGFSNKRWWKAIKGIEHILNMFKLIITLILLKPDVVHFQWIVVPSFDIFCIKVLKYFGMKVYVTAHNSLPHDSGEKHLKLYKTLYCTVDGIFVHSDKTAIILSDVFGIDKSKVCTIYHGNFCYLNELIPIVLSETEKELFIFCRNNKSALKIISFGLIRPYKGLNHLLESLSLARASGNEVCLIICGKYFDAQYKKSIDELINKYNISDFVFITNEFVSENNIKLLSSWADVAAFPYDKIDQSGAALAMLSVGKPLIVANVGGLSQLVIEGVNGFIIDNDNKAQELNVRYSTFIKYPEIKSIFSDESLNMANSKFGWEGVAIKSINFYQV